MGVVNLVDLKTVPGSGDGNGSRRTLGAIGELEGVRRQPLSGDRLHDRQCRGVTPVIGSTVAVPRLRRAQEGLSLRNGP